MPLKDLLLKILGKKRQSEALSSDNSALERFQSDITALEPKDKTEKIPPTESSIELQKDSLQLGIAAGYTGRSLREIESSLLRIESQMPTKDWFLLQFKDRTPELINILMKNEENARSRFEIIQNSITNIRVIAATSPEPLKSRLNKEASSIESQLPLTSKMLEVLEIVKEDREISYDDLAKRLKLNEVSGLRGLLSNMIKRTNQIERFGRGKKGWVKLTGIEDLKRFESANGRQEALLRDRFEKIVEKDGFSIARRFSQTSPDLIIEKDGKTIGVELKAGTNISSLEKALGQLLYARDAYNLQEIWLVVPRPSQIFPANWLNIFNSQGIKVLILDEETLTSIN